MPTNYTQLQIRDAKMQMGRAQHQKRHNRLAQREAVRRMLQQATKDDRNNAEMLYRYGYFLMSEGRYSKAIGRFELALEKNGKRNCTFPLTEAQLYKAHMYIGYCGSQLLKQSWQKVKELDIEQAAMKELEIDGKDIDEVLRQLENHSEYYYAVENGVDKMISAEEYISHKSGVSELLVISYVEDEPFMKYGIDDPITLTEQQAAFSKFLMERLVRCAQVDIDEINLEFSERPWETVRRAKDRLNDIVSRFESLRDRELFIIPQGNFEKIYPQAFALGNIPYIYITRKPNFAE
ncbi:hypothetical protein [Solibacillus sp. FSL H8-0538]|uniref:hypothetical protein n=1 Tax=Solibacillus sp. FSL H8-0538 TaxID=2921400 RepID=UPI0030FA397B